jgi:hypothetical protein
MPKLLIFNETERGENFTHNNFAFALTYAHKKSQQEQCLAGGLDGGWATPCPAPTWKRSRGTEDFNVVVASPLWAQGAYGGLV